MLTSADWRGVEELHICLVLPVIFSRLFICMVDVTIFGFNLSFVQLQVVPCFSSGPTGKVWGPTSRSELPCYDSQPTVLYCCHCHCQGTGARYALTTAPGSFRCLGVNIQYTRTPDWYRAWSELPCRDAAMILNSMLAAHKWGGHPRPLGQQSCALPLCYRPLHSYYRKIRSTFFAL